SLNVGSDQLPPLPVALLYDGRSTSSSGSGTGSERNSTGLTTLKMAVFAPMPSASATSAVSVKPGVRSRLRSPNVRSRSIASPGLLQQRGLRLSRLVDDAAVEQRHRAGRVARVLVVVRHHHDGGAALVQLLQELHHRLAV